MDPREYFALRIRENESDLKRLNRIAFLLSLSRLAIFLAAVLTIYFYFNNTAVVAISLVVGLAGFLFLVSRYSDVKNQRDFHQKIKDLNLLELKALDGDHSHFEDGAEFLDNDHPYNRDIDLFGEGSLFQRLNRTGTKSGKKKLAQLLNANDISEITEKQAATVEMRDNSDWRQDFQVTAAVIKNEVDTKWVLKLMTDYKSAIPGLFRYLSLAFTLASLIIIVLYGVGLLPFAAVVIDLTVGLAISGLYIKKVNKLYQEAGKMKATFGQYGKLIRYIEQRNFSAAELKVLKAQLDRSGKTASQTLAALSTALNNLDQRNNFFFALLGNGFLLWDLKFACKIEKWIEENRNDVARWFEVIATFDAMNGLANFAFVHQEFTFPELTSGTVVVDAKSLGHPLIRSAKRIDNDVEIRKGNFIIITGANMAGKSTFLRTVALNIVMANIGLPVCARSFRYAPIKLISSMRTSDSLKDDESYFFSELKRLKFIVDEVGRDTYFIILDEILKGTNSKDKAEGSQQFVERLAASHSTGLIATHDLSLCVLSERLDQVKNFYFDAQIVNDELYFDYRFKEGICQNMNASFLLKKMGIV